MTPQEGPGAPADQPTWLVKREVLVQLARQLRDDPATRFDLLLDLGGVDYPDRPDAEGGRFEAVYHLYSLPRGERLRLKVPVTEGDPVLPSLIPVWKAADWFEREAYDMFGLRFDGHPNLRRILTHEAFQGHPLRKDYDPARRWLLTDDQVYRPRLEAPPTSAADDELFERMTINIGPSHPAMHGTFRLTAMLDGETIIASDVEIGYLHRCFEKMSETHTWQQVIPFTDRLNYCSSFINNVGYCKTVEQMLEVEPPPKAVWARTVLSEFSRIMDHCVCNGTTLVDAGALTNFWYMFQPREEIYGLLEACFGARLTVAGCRIGGLMYDLPPDFMPRARRLLEIIPPFIDDVDRLVSKNRIWMDRSVGIAAISGQEAVDWGWTGPCLRASGVAYDVRRAHPYDLYDTVDWEVPVLYGGDVYDRY
ncbi:MAG TPA: NADH-quinone oxidoreductase subunit C, partial [Thermoanaerobaculia bacterium]|nr:NADH-quinone oxidoreductase subunit C [Thermoanaerobaculia bacterium]